MRGGSDAHGAVERAREVGGNDPSDLAGGAGSTHLGELGGGIPAGPPLDGAVGVRLGRDRLVGGQRHLGIGGDTRHRPQPAHRLLRQLDPEGLDQVQHVRREAGVPRLVRIDADLHVGTNGLPHRLDRANVVLARAELQLDRRIAVADPVRGLLRDVFGRAGRQRRVAADRLGLAGAGQLPHGHAGRLRDHVEDRALERGGGRGGDAARQPKLDHGRHGERERIVEARFEIDIGEPPGRVFDLALDLAHGLVPAKRQRDRFAEALEACVGLQAQEHHLALADLATGSDVRRSEGQRVRDRLGALDLHRQPRTRPSDTSRLKTPSSAPVPANAAFSEGPSVRVCTA